MVFRRVLLALGVVSSLLVGLPDGAAADDAAYAASVVGSGAASFWEFDELVQPVTDSIQLVSAPVAAVPPVLGAASPLDGSLGLLFEDAGQALRVPIPEGVGPALSVEVLAAPAVASGRMRLVRAHPDGIGLDFLADTRQFEFWGYGQDGAGRFEVTAPPVEAGALTHVVATYDGQTARLFLDGVEVGSDTLASAADLDISSPDLVVGGDPGLGNRNYFGLLDGLALYDRALAASEIEEHAAAVSGVGPPPPTLDAYEERVVALGAVAYLRFDDDGAGPVVVDTVGAGDALQTSPGPDRGVPGMREGSSGFGFNDPSHVVEPTLEWFGDESSLRSEFSIEFWFETDSDAARQRIVRLRNYGFFVDYLGVSDNIQARVYTGTSERATITSPKLGPGWHHVVLTFAGGVTRLVVDGKSAGVHAEFAGSTVYTGSANVYIGNDRPGVATRAFAGSLDDLALYPTALTVAEARLNYETAGYTAPGLPSTRAIANCYDAGGNVYFAEPTWVETERGKRFVNGCQQVWTCQPTVPSGPWTALVIEQLQVIACENQEQLVSVLGAIGLPFELLMRVDEATGMFVVGGHLAPEVLKPTGGLYQRALTTLVSPAEAAPTASSPARIPSSAGGWARVGGGLALVSGVAYATSLWLEPDERATQTALLTQPSLISDIAAGIRPDPTLATEEEQDRDRHIAARECVVQIATLGVPDGLAGFNSRGFNSNGDHVCQELNVFYPGSRRYVIARGVLVDHWAATQQTADAIAGGAPAMVHRGAATHSRSWFRLRATNPDGNVICDTLNDQHCDEYPYASNLEGGHANYLRHWNDPVIAQLGLWPVNVQPVLGSHNTREGSALNVFYGAANGCGIARLAVPTEENRFLVVPMVGQTAPTTTHSCAN